MKKAIFLELISMLLMGSVNIYSIHDTELREDNISSNVFRFDKYGNKISGIIISKEFGSLSAEEYLNGRLNGTHYKLSDMYLYIETPFINNNIDGVQKIYPIDKNIFNLKSVLKIDNISELYFIINNTIKSIKKSTQPEQEIEYKKDGCAKLSFIERNSKVTILTSYLNGKREGIEKEYFETSKNKILVETSYTNDEKNGKSKTYVDDKITLESTYKNNALNGEIIFYDDKKKIIGNIQHNNFEGLFRVIDTNLNKIIFDMTFLKNKVINARCYDEEGNKKQLTKKRLIFINKITSNLLQDDYKDKSSLLFDKDFWITIFARESLCL